MVPHVWRIADDEIEAGSGLRVREVGKLHREAAISPEVRRRRAVVSVDLETDSFGVEFGGQNFAERGIKGTGPDRRVEEMDFLAGRKKGSRVFEDVLGQGRGRRELAEAVSLGLCLLAVKFGLKGEALLFKNVDRLLHFQIPKRVKSSIRCSQTQSIPSAAS